MTLVQDVQRLQDKCRELEREKDDLRTHVNRLEEQVNGERGLSAVLTMVLEEIKGLRKGAYWVAGVIVAGAIAFAFAALQLSAGGI